jgi:hypothetical protein
MEVSDLSARCLSKLADATIRLSGLNATESTPPVCPSRVARNLGSWAAHRPPANKATPISIAIANNLVMGVLLVARRLLACLLGHWHLPVERVISVSRRGRNGKEVMAISHSPKSDVCRRREGCRRPPTIAGRNRWGIFGPGCHAGCRRLWRFEPRASVLRWPTWCLTR